MEYLLFSVFISMVISRNFRHKSRHILFLNKLETILRMLLNAFIFPSSSVYTYSANDKCVMYYEERCYIMLSAKHNEFEFWFCFYIGDDLFEYYWIRVKKGQNGNR